jgi:hypothetical protein
MWCLRSACGNVSDGEKKKACTVRGNHVAEEKFFALRAEPAENLLFAEIGRLDLFVLPQRRRGVSADDVAVV